MFRNKARTGDLLRNLPAGYVIHTAPRDRIQVNSSDRVYATPSHSPTPCNVSLFRAGETGDSGSRAAAAAAAYQVAPPKVVRPGTASQTPGLSHRAGLGPPGSVCLHPDAALLQPLGSGGSGCDQADTEALDHGACVTPQHNLRCSAVVLAAASSPWLLSVISFG